MVKKPVFWLSALLATALVAPTSQAPKGNRALSRIAGPAKVKGSFGPAEAQVRSDPGFGVMPLAFIANEGQLEGNVAFYIKGNEKSLYFGSDGITFILRESVRSASPRDRRPRAGPRQPPRGQDLKTWAVKLDFVGAEPGVRPVGRDEADGIVSYFKGKPANWKAGIPTYSKLVYHNLWPGIDVVYSGTVDQLKYEFVVQPGADPGRIRLAYRGASEVRIDEEGRLEIMTPCGSFQDGAPVAYQEVDGRRVPVSMVYDLDAPGENSIGYGFRIGNYDRTLPLVLDPVVFVYCGFIGGNNDDGAYDIAVDGTGNVYLTGYVWSGPATFPVTVGPGLTVHLGYDAFVAKLNAAGTSFVYCGYIGGDGYDDAEGIAVDNAGNAYIAGSTTSTQTTFPVLTGPDLTYNGSDDTFVAKVNPSRTALLYCGYIGGSANDYAFGVKVGSSGSAYVAGYALSTEATFPETVGPDLTHNGSSDGFVAKINASGSALVYCGYIGGSSGEFCEDLALDTAENVYVSGETGSTETTFPVLGGPDLTYNGSWDAFIAKINSSNASLVYCGYVGGADEDDGYGIAVDRAGNAYLTGETYSDETTFSVLGGPDLTHNGGEDAFVAKIVEEPLWKPHHAVGDFGTTGLWLWDSGIWTQLSNVNPDFMIGADTDGDGAGEVVGDFGALGLWLVDGGIWTPISGVNPEYVFSGDFDGDNADEIMEDFGALGLWLWNGGAWSQVSAGSPE
jgi:hypothetical protein